MVTFDVTQVASFERWRVRWARFLPDPSVPTRDAPEPGGVPDALFDDADRLRTFGAYQLCLLDGRPYHHPTQYPARRATPLLIQIKV